ncbi:MAG: dihydrofolate reductase family protein [Roseburia sp.]
MRKVVLYIAMSLDGYIADQNGDVAWLAGDGSDSANEGSYPGFVEGIDTVILGHRTYHQITTELSPGEWVYSGMKSYVMTHKKIPSTEEIIFTDKPVRELIGALKAESGKDIWICGGASLVNQMLAEGLIDEFCISVIPTILGEGIRLFDRRPGAVELEFMSVQTYNGITDLVYRLRK